MIMISKWPELCESCEARVSVSHVTGSRLSPRVTHQLASSPANDGYHKSVTTGPSGHRMLELVRPRILPSSTENIRVQQSINQTRGNSDNSEHFVSVVTTRTFRSIRTLWARPTRHRPRPHNTGHWRGHQSHKRLKGSVYKDSALIEHEDNLYL